MSRYKEFRFSAVPGRQSKVTIDLDKVGLYNPCPPGNGFDYTRTHVYLVGESEPIIFLDIEYDEFKKIIESNENPTRNI